MPLLHARYRFVKKLGQGRFSTVLHCVDTFLPSQPAVAIKVRRARPPRARRPAPLTVPRAQVMHCGYAAVGHHEAAVLARLRRGADFDAARLCPLHASFTLGGHVCLVFDVRWRPGRAAG